MARTSLAITDITTQPPNAQLVTVASDLANGNMFLNDGRTILIVNNNTGGALTITIASISDRFGRSDTVLTNFSVAAGTLRIMGPFPAIAWNQVAADIGNVYINTSATTLQLGAFRLAATGSTP